MLAVKLLSMFSQALSQDWQELRGKAEPWCLEREGEGRDTAVFDREKNSLVIFGNVCKYHIVT